MLIRIIPVIALAALLVAGCDKSTTDTSTDVAKARKDARQDLSEAQQDAYKTEQKANEKVAAARQEYTETDASAHAKLTAVESEAMINTARADFDVAMAAAEGRYKIAKEKCGTFKGVDNNACLSTADAAFAADKAEIIAHRDMALVQAEHHD